MKDDFVCVYGIRCTETGRIYIGSTCNLDTRLKNHFRRLKNGCMKDVFQSDFDLFGMKSFEVFVLEQDIPKHERDKREEYWISLYHAYNPNYGYNIYKRCVNGCVHRDTKLPVPVYIGLPPVPEVGDDYE